MAVRLRRVDVAGFDAATAALRDWQRDGLPFQLHPGDLGWFRRFGADAAAEAVRIWTRGDRTLAIGLLDEPALLRLAIAPDAHGDEELARPVLDDVSTPDGGVFAPGQVSVEAPAGALLQDSMSAAGWGTDEPWTPLRRDLAAPVESPGIRIEVVGPERVADRVAVQRASFDESIFTVERWGWMSDGNAYRDARCLVAYDDAGTPVAAVTVWSAGAGRPGLLEPMGVARDFRGHGYGRAVTLAAAAALRELGASSALVCTPSSNVGAVATYRAAGFAAGAEVADRVRDLRAGPES